MLIGRFSIHNDGGFVEEEDVCLKFGQVGVEADDIGKGGVLHIVDDSIRQGSLIPETVTITQTAELIDEDCGEGLAEAGVGQVVFGEAADPQVNVVHAAIGGGEGGLQGFV